MVFPGEFSDRVHGALEHLLLLPSHGCYTQIYPAYLHLSGLGPGRGEHFPVLHAQAPHRSGVSGEQAVVDRLPNRISVTQASPKEQVLGFQCWLNACISWSQQPAFVSCSTMPEESTLAHTRDQLNVIQVLRAVELSCFQVALGTARICTKYLK